MNAKPTAIAVILEHLADKAVIQEFRGTLTKLYDMKTGGEGDRAWSKQQGELKDAAGDTIPVDFWRDGQEIPKTWKGKELILTSVTGQKGAHGVMVYDDSYNNKTTRRLKVTGKAEIAFAGDDPPQASTQPAQSQKPASGSQSAQSAPPRGLSLRAAILRRATVWRHCLDAAVAVAHTVNHDHGYAMVPAGVNGLATTLFIETMRNLHGDLSAIDPKEIAWENAKGKNLRDLCSALDRQVMETRVAQTPPPAGASDRDDEPPPPAKTPMQELEEQDEIPF